MGGLYWMEAKTLVAAAAAVLCRSINYINWPQIVFVFRKPTADLSCDCAVKTEGGGGGDPFLSLFDNKIIIYWFVFVCRVVDISSAVVLLLLLHLCVLALRIWSPRYLNCPALLFSFWPQCEAPACRRIASADGGD